MKNTLKAVFFDPYRGEGTAYVSTVTNEWRSITQALECEWMQIVCRRFGKRTYAIVCDDEGLLKEQNKDKISIATANKNDEVIEIIVGKILVCKVKGENLQSLSNSDIKLILSKRVVIFDSEGKQKFALKCSL